MNTIQNKLAGRLKLALLLGLGLIAGVVGAQPANDNFTSASAIAGLAGNTSGDSTSATLEPCEINEVYCIDYSALHYVTNSAWFAWTAPVNGSAEFDTLGSSYDTVLSVWTSTNSSPVMCDGSLTNLISDDDTGKYLFNNFGDPGTSYLTFQAVAGTTYYVSVDSFDDGVFTNAGSFGPYLLNWDETPAPPNDDFTNAWVLTGLTGITNGDNAAATLEPCEAGGVNTDDNGFVNVSNSVWFAWTAPASGPAEFDTIGSDFDTVLSVWTTTNGLCDESLVNVVSDDNSGGFSSAFSSQLTFSAVAGTTYYLSVAGSANNPDFNIGSYVLEWDQVPTPPPNDDFANADVIAGMTGTTNGYNDWATLEDCEPDAITTDDLAGVTNSVWYAWTAPTSGTAIFNTFGSGFDTVLAVYTTPSDLCDQGLTLVAADDDYISLVVPQSQVSFTAVAGTTYYISVNGNPNPSPGYGAAGNFDLNWNVIVPSISSGTFVFTSPTYTVGDNDETPPTSIPLDLSSWLGARVTVTRTDGSSGRVLVPYTVTGDANEPGATGGGTLVFDDYQMSADIAVPVTPITPLTANIMVGTNTVTVNYAPPAQIVVTLGTPTLDPLESPDLIPPLGGGNTASIQVLSDSYPAAPSATPIFNIERSTFRADRAIGNAIIYVTTSQAPPVGHTYTVNYAIDADPILNSFALQADSDYATPGTDFTSVSGTLTWNAGDGKPKTITIPIDDVANVTFNEDLQIELSKPRDTSIPADLALGQVNTATVTILFNVQPAGAVDQVWNKDGFSDSTPPYLNYPGTDGGISDGANGNGGTVNAVAEQPDGKLIVAGSFISFDSNPYNHIVRLLNNGYQDTTFLAVPNSGADNTINAVALQPNGKIIIGGNFTSFNGVTRYHIARLNTDGSLDGTFNPGLGVNGVVRALALQANGQIVIGGSFTSVNGTNMVNVARLNANGSLDTSFNPGTGPDSAVYAVAVDATNRVYIGGAFDSVAGQSSGGVARLNTNGVVDSTFSPGIGTYNPNSKTTDPVYALALQSNGQLLAGGAFSWVEMTGINGLCRFNTDGTVDLNFSTLGTTNGTWNPATSIVDAVNTITLDSSQKILIGGNFMNVNQTRRVGIARLFADGSLDTSFMDTAYNQFAGIINHYHNVDAINTNDYPQGNNRNSVNAIALEADGNVIIGGNFLQVGGGSYGHSGSIDSVAGAGIIDNGRMDVHPRSNVARLIGGSTTGPGNMEFCNFNIASTKSYTVDKDAGTLFVTMTRTNGNLGTISATLFAPPGAVGQPGIAAEGTNFTIGNTEPEWTSMWNTSWTMSDGYEGPNNNIVIPGNSATEFFTIFNDTALTGNLNANLALTAPNPGLFFLGGELIPLGAALGANFASPLTIIDDNFPAGTFSFSSATYSINEGNTNATITVVRNNGSKGSVNVSYLAYNGTATTTNYTPVNGTLLFVDGVLTNTFTVPIIAYSTLQPDKTVNLRLYSISGGGLPGLTNAVLTIVDNNFGAGHVAFAYATNGVNENAGTVNIVINRLGGSTGTLGVTAITSDGSAVSGTNYTGSTNAVSWISGDASPKTVTVPILHDGIYTSNLMFNISLTNGLAGGVASTNVLGLSIITNSTVVITNVDFPGTVEFSAGAYSVKKYAGYASIPVIRTGGSAGILTVTNYTYDGTASNGVDYAGLTNVLTFTNGQVSQFFNIPITAGSTSGLVSLNLVLTNAVAVNASLPWTNALGSPNQAVLNILDTDTLNEPPGSPDVSYSPLNGFNAPIYALALQTNNQLVVGGDFTMANGVYRQRFARLNDDGTLDSTFLLPSATKGADNSVRAIAIQTDGRILVGGYFTNFNSVTVNGIARLNYDGSLDSSFITGSGADNPVYAVAQTFVNGQLKVLVGGSFAHLNGVLANGIGRLDGDTINGQDGRPDTSFNTGTGANGTVYALAVQADGRVVIGGDFTAVNGVPSGHIARLNTDGSVDLTFTNASASDSVRAIAIQLDGQILVGGLFSSVNGNTNFNHIARLNSADGTPDGTFNPGLGANNSVFGLAVQTDGRIVVGGVFSQAGGVTRNRITRLNPDGTTDPTINFGVGADNFVAAVAVEESTIAGYPASVPDEKIIIGGGFLNYFGASHPYLARIYGGSVGGSGAFTFSSAYYGVNENGSNVVITVNRAGGTSGTNGDGSGDIFVTFAATNGTAQAGVNYSSVLTNLDFPMGEVQETVTIPVMDDQAITSNLTVNLSLSPIAPGQSGDQPTALLTITNVDSAISFQTANYQVNKYGSNVLNSFAPIYVSRLGATFGTSTVVFSTTTNGTATAGVDYQPLTNVLVTFAPGVTGQQVNIPIINGVSDGDTTVGLQLTNVTGSALYDPSNAVLTILDQTLAKGSFVFSTTNYVVSAGAGVGQTLATITVLRTNGASGIVSVSYNTADGTALGGIQYVPTSGSLTFGDGVTSQTFTVPVYNTYVANVALNLSLLLSNPTGGAGLLSPTNATLTILNTNTGFYFAAATNTAPENSGFVSLTLLRNNTNGLAAVDFFTADGTGTNAAVNGTNYISQGGTLVFADGQLSTNIIVPLIYDEQVTGDLQFTVGLTNPNQAQLIAPTNAVVIVQDADAGVSFTNVATSVLKNGTNALLAVVCSNPRVEPVTVSYFTADGTATNGIDYTATNGTLVFAGGVTTNTIKVRILNNNLLEGNVNFSVMLTNATYPGQLVSPSTNLVTIIDSNPGISFSSPVYAWTRAAGVQALINVYRTGNTDSVMSVNYKTADGTGTNGFDYVATSGTLVFTNGVTNQTFAVTVINRLGVLTAKTVLLSLFNPTNGVLVAPTNAVLTLLSDTNTYLSFALATNSVPENAGFVGLTVSRFNNPAGTVSVTFATADGTAAAGVNYTATNGVLIFTNGQLSQTINVPLIYDPLVTGDLQFTAGLTNPVGALLIAPSNTVVIVQDADAGVSFTNASTSVLKNGTNAVLAVVCSNPRVEPVTVGYFTADGTATNGIDYTATNGTLVFAGGVTTNYITVPILNNNLLEGNVNFSVMLTNAAYPGQLVSPSTNVVTIIDSNPGVSFSSPTYSVVKTGVQALINVYRTGYTDSVMSVNFATADGTATNGIDYVSTNGTLMFTNGVTNLTFAVTVINHSAVQPPKTVLLSLFNPTNAVMAVPTNAVLTITDTNAGIIFASANYSFIETTPFATINVLRFNNTSGTNTVNWSTTNGPAIPGIGAALAGINYSAIVNQPLTFYPGVTNITVFVPLLYDTNATGPLQLTAGLASSTPGVVIGTPGATVIVLQDADTGLSFSTNASTVLKNAGSITITVLCSNTNVEPVSVNYSTTNGTATAGTDYTATSGTLTFSNGMSALTFPVPISNNSLITGNLIFYVNLSNPTGTGRLVSPSQQAVTIDDSNSGLMFSSSTYTVLKTNGPAVITVYRTDNTNTTTTVNYLATNGTAANGVNFVATNGTLIFTNGVTSQTFSVPIIPTGAVQPDLTVLLTLSAPVNGILFAPSAATLTIRDNTGSYVIPAGTQMVTNYTSLSDYTNNLIGSNDTVQVLFAFRDASLVNVTNLIATLLPNSGVTNPVPSSQVYGPLTAYGHSVSMPFTFTANGTNGQQIAATFQLQDGAKNIGTNIFGFTLGTTATVFSNNAAIIINDAAAASPYPSVINVSGVGGSLIKATVTLNRLSHTDPHDVSALVTVPGGTNTLLMSHAGGNGYGVTNIVLTFDDAATNSLPSSGALTTGTNKPTGYSPPNKFP